MSNLKITRITILLTKEDAELFKKFREYQSVWIKVFQIRGGSTTLHFDEFGKIREVEYKYKNKIKVERA